MGGGPAGCEPPAAVEAGAVAVIVDEREWRRILGSFETDYEIEIEPHEC